MRIDKFLKVSRIIKRRTIANEACDRGRVLINGKTAKASSEVKTGDILEISIGEKTIKVRVIKTDLKTSSKADAPLMYQQFD